MLAVGLTGGIGSGKSTVADLLVERGAILIDADRIAREVVGREGAAYAPLVDRFGPQILAADGSIDRKALAQVAFTDPAKLGELNSITHPLIGARMLEMRNEQEGTDHVVVLDIPLLKPVHRDTLALDFVVVVDCPVDLAVDRLVSQRGFERADAEARVASQTSREERLAGANFIVDNSTTREALVLQVDELWRVLAIESEQRADGAKGAGRERRERD